MKDKIPFYEIVNKFFIGAVFVLLYIAVSIDRLPLICFYNQYSGILKDWNIIISVVLLIAMYEIGFIINRSSSVIIAPILRITRIWPTEEYTIDISDIKKQNDTFNSMITELVAIRSHILMYIVLAIISLLYCKYYYSLVFLLFVVLFTISGRKHNKRIRKILTDYRNKHSDKPA